MSTATITAFAIRKINSRIERAQGIIAKLQTGLVENPAYALSWAQDSFSAAADLKVCSIVKAHIEKGIDLEKIAAEARERTLSHARSPQFSTSTCSNLINLMEGTAWAELSCLLDDLLASEK